MIIARNKQWEGILYGAEFVDDVIWPTDLKDCRITIPTGRWRWRPEWEDLRKAAEYQCPWTMNTFYWIYPLGVLSGTGVRFTAGCGPSLARAAPQWIMGVGIDDFLVREDASIAFCTVRTDKEDLLCYTLWRKL